MVTHIPQAKAGKRWQLHAHHTYWCQRKVLVNEKRVFCVLWPFGTHQSSSCRAIGARLWSDRIANGESFRKDVNVLLAPNQHEYLYSWHVLSYCDTLHYCSSITETLTKDSKGLMPKTDLYLPSGARNFEDGHNMSKDINILSNPYLICCVYGSAIISKYISKTTRMVKYHTLCPMEKCSAY